MPNSQTPMLLPPPSGDGGVPIVGDIILGHRTSSELVTLHPVQNQQNAEKDVVPFAHYFWVLRRHRWKILAFVIICVAATVIASYRLTPYYESTATVEIDRQVPSTVIGQDSRDHPTVNDSDQFLATQVKLFQSDSVTRPVVQKLNLPAEDIETRESKLPTTSVEDAPIILKRLQIARVPGTYILLVSYRSPNPQLAADVANSIVRSYIDHVYALRYQASAGLSAFMEKQLEELRARMEKSSGALAAFEKDFNVVNPDEKTNILSARLLQLNAEYTTAQGDRVRKEAAFNGIKGGSIDAAEASVQGEQLRKLGEHLNTAKEKFATVASQYGDHHPEYKKAASEVKEVERQIQAMQKSIEGRVSVEYKEAQSREDMLKKDVAETKAEYDALNARSFEYKALKDEAESDKGLYQELVRKIKEAGINASFQNSSIRLADAARPTLKPVFPNLRLNALLAFICATLIAISAAIMSDVLDHTLRDPDQIRQALGVDVIGSLPVVKTWRGRKPMFGANPTTKALMGGNRGNPHPHVRQFEEAMRTLRDSVLVPDLEKRPRSLLISSATPREGKSVVAVQFALAHSRQRRRTLIIDGDLRRPSIHRYLGIANDAGLSNVVNGQAAWRDMIRTFEFAPDLSVIPAGPESEEAIDCLGTGVRAVLAEAVKEYDLVILDAPPLGFAESMQMAALVDGVVFVALPGKTNRNAIVNAMNSARRVNARIIGVALNEINSALSEQYYYYGDQRNSYKQYYGRSPKDA